MAKDKDIPPFMEDPFKSFKDFNFPAPNMEDLMSIYKKNIELMNSTQQIAIEATKTMMELQRDYMKRAVDQWNARIKDTDLKTPLEEQATAQMKAAKDAISETVEHIQELNSILAKSNEKIKDSFQKRIKEGLDEASNLAKNKKK